MKRLFGIIATAMLTVLLGITSAKAQQSVNPLVNSQLPNAYQGQAQYDAAKENWVKEHPAEYKELSDPAAASAARVQADKPYGKIENKEAWIREHEDLYLEMQKPLEERKVLSREELKSFPAEKQKSMLADPNFKIID